MKSYKIETLEFLTTEDEDFKDFINKIKDRSKCEELEILNLCELFFKDGFATGLTPYYYVQLITGNYLGREAPITCSVNETDLEVLINEVN